MPREPLWPFLLFQGLADDELIEAYRQVYLETYVYKPDGSKRIFQDWTKAQVNFSAHAFKHAFSSTSGFREGLDHDAFSVSRAKRMLWIKEVLAGKKGTVQRYNQLKTDSRGRAKKRRTFVVCEERYIVVLDNPDKPGKPFQFVTAFASSDHDYLTRCKEAGALIETLKDGK
jgi:hypothetical protein